MSHSESTTDSFSGDKSLDQKLKDIIALAKSDHFSNLSKNHKIIKLREILSTIDQLQRELTIIRTLTQDHLIDIQLTSQLKMFDSKLNRKSD